MLALQIKLTPPSGLRPCPLPPPPPPPSSLEQREKGGKEKGGDRKEGREGSGRVGSEGARTRDSD